MDDIALQQRRQFFDFQRDLLIAERGALCIEHIMRRFNVSKEQATRIDAGYNDEHRRMVEQDREQWSKELASSCMLPGFPVPGSR